jgi:hypothetical protein
MTDWQLTATTIFCDDIGDEVTILVYKDGKTRCTGYDTFIKMNTGADKKKRSNGVECHGPVCFRVAEYRDKLFSEEKGGS